jgi:hypothetical protein
VPNDAILKWFPYVFPLFFGIMWLFSTTMLLMPVLHFMDRFSKYVAELPDYSLGSSKWVRAFDFEVGQRELGPPQ